jgi:hypothetical protein
MKRMAGGSRMVGGAETALLTLDDSGQPGGETGAPGGDNFIAPTSKPAKFINFLQSFAAAKAIIKKYNEKQTPNKKDLRLASSELFDIYSYATPQARGVFDSSVPLNGFVDELNEGVRLKPDLAKVFFTSLVDLIEETVPDANAPAPVLESQTAMGSGKGGGCGCCSGCGGRRGGAEPADTTKVPTVPALKAPSPAGTELSTPQKTNVVNNVLEWIKKKRESMGKSGKPEPQPEDKTLEKLAKENDKTMPPIGRGISSLAAINNELKKKAKGKGHPVYGMKHKQGLPGRIQKLRAKVASIQKSPESSDSESDSDVEVSGGMHGGKKGNRAQIVKGVMKKRGVSMIEASKIVKAEGLY